MKKTYLQSSWSFCLSFLVAMLAGLCVVGCESNNSDSGDGGGGGGGNTVTFAQYDAIKAYMSYNDVVGIMGRNPDESHSSSMTTVYVWKADWASGDPEFIEVAIIDPPITISHLDYGAWAKNCSIYNSNHTLVGRNDTLYEL